MTTSSRGASVARPKSGSPLILNTLLLALVSCSSPDSQPDGAVDQLPRAEAPAEDEAPPGADRPVVGAAVQPAVEEYRERCREPDVDGSNQSVDERTATCIRVLSGALASVIGRDTIADTPLRELLAQYRASAERIERLDPGSRLTGDIVGAVFQSAAAVMNHVARTREGITEQQRAAAAATVREAGRVDRSVPAGDQWSTIRSFFERSGRTIEALERS